MNNKNDIIFLIDDDDSVRRSITLLLKSEQYNVESFQSAEEFLERDAYAGTGCIILDVNLEGKSGLELQEDLLKTSSHLPIIFITGKGDIPMSVQALKKGAINFLLKPFNDNQLLSAVEEALEKCSSLKEKSDEILKAKKIIEELTPREYEILQYVLTGMLNKQISSELNISEQTVKIHRGKITEKLGIKSVAEIVRLAEIAGIKLPKSKY